MTIAVDFDGTIVREAYPEIGKEIPFAVETLRQLARDGHHLLLWTVREGELLEEALDWCRKRGLEFYAVNNNFPGEQDDTARRYSRKLRVDVFIDDRNLGGLPDWGVIYKMIKEQKTLAEVLLEQMKAGDIRQKPKHWWKR